MTGIVIKKTAKGSSITLGAEYDITQAQVMTEKLRPLLKRSSAITINASHVEHVDTAILQVLVMFKRAADAKQISIEWRKPSESLRRVANLLNLTKEMGLK